VRGLLNLIAEAMTSHPWPLKPRDRNWLPHGGASYPYTGYGLGFRV
jgi:hypothetical protein